MQNQRVLPVEDGNFSGRKFNARKFNGRVNGALIAAAVVVGCAMVVRTFALSLDQGDHRAIATVNGLATLLIPGVVAYGFKSAGKSWPAVVKAFTITASVLLITDIIRGAVGGGPYS